MANTKITTAGGWSPKVPLGQQQNFGTSGSIFGIETALSVTAGTDQILPPGLFMVVTPTSGSAVYTPDSGNTTRTLIPASSGGLVISDGQNVRLSSASGTVNFFYTPIGSL